MKLFGFLLYSSNGRTVMPEKRTEAIQSTINLITQLFQKVLSTKCGGTDMAARLKRLVDALILNVHALTKGI